MNRTTGNQKDNEPVSPSFAARLDAAKHESTLQLLFKAARLLDEEALDRIAQKPGRPRLRRSHMSLFPHIALEGTRITDLAERLGVTKQAVSQLVDDLVGFGVLSKTRDPEDARARRVVFTEQGREGIFEGLGTLRELEQELASAIGERPIAELRHALIAILHLVEPAK